MKRVVKQKTMRLAVGCGALLALVPVGVWLWKAHQLSEIGGKPNVTTVAMNHPFFLNLRNWLVFRGEQPPGTHRGPIQLPREGLDLTLWLPVGSEPGKYEVQISTDLGKTLVTATGRAVIRKDGITFLEVKLETSKLNQGGYVLGIREIGSEPYTYPLILNQERGIWMGSSWVLPPPCVTKL